MFHEIRSHRLTQHIAALAASGSCALLAGCTSTPAPLDGALFLVSGQETDTWTASPAPQTVEVDLVGTMRTQLASVAAPADSVDLGAGQPAETVAKFDVTGYDASGAAVVHGNSVTYSIASFAYAEPVTFVGRTNGISRGPGNLLFEYRHPLVETVGHAYSIISGGDLGNANAPALDIYDMVNWIVAPQQTWLTAEPKSWAVSGLTLLVLNSSGGTAIDLSTYAATQATPPAGLDFASVVGGKTVAAADDTRYIVGATRATGDATDGVLRINTDGTFTALTLTAPRRGAAAGIVNGQLVVVGGSDTASGAEILNAAGNGFVALDYPADAAQGAALTQLDSTTALVAGGSDASGTLGALRTLDVTCSKSCAVTPLADLDFAFPTAQAVSLADNQLLVTGEDADGQTHLFTLVKTSDFALTEVPLRIPRSAATLALFPNGQAGIVGGDALADGSPAQAVELYFPPM